MCRFGDGQLAGLGAVIAQRLARDGFAVAVNGLPGDEQVAAVGRAMRDGGAPQRASAPMLPMSARSPDWSPWSRTASAPLACWCLTPPARSRKGL
jgi:NAD(P)-dependent dehydrogenase (short-subunit alcohol dehydrogenase family)